MRKKSHISLAGYLVNSKEFKGIEKHKKAFYFGSIQPDCVPSFITRKHRIDTTFDILKKEMVKLTEKKKSEKDFNRYFCRHLGVVTHYIADYFTYPHNEAFDGSFRDHCAYEKELTEALREYVSGRDVLFMRINVQPLSTIDDICRFIRDRHEEYARTISVIKRDCRYIVELCRRVVDAILQIAKVRWNQLDLAAA